ncbi:MAG: polyprenyl synthetase family protein [Planctomycetota bacterium]|nr:polyprenyl synthetase family protein [Planctomycetota bacterium]
MAASDLARTFLSEARGIVDAALDAWLPADDPRAPRLAEAMRYSVEAGGKRLRPALALAACRAVGGRDTDVLPFAGALELIHTYSLIHDDLPAMDDDDLRRGRPTSHKVYGEAQAILAGDAMHTLAFELLLTQTPDASTACQLGALLAQASGHDGMVGGQVDDLAAEGAGADGVDVERLESIHRRKTGALLTASVRGGALAAGAGPAAVDALTRYGTALGLAFQIADDVLDATSTADVLGKTPGKDAADAKLTYVALEGVDAARARCARETERALEALAGLPGLDGEGAALLTSIAHFVAQRDR